MTTILFLYFFHTIGTGTNTQVVATSQSQEFASPNECKQGLYNALKMAEDHGTIADGYCILKKGHRGPL